MSDLMLGLGQMIAVVVIVGGVSIALWQVWVLANKLCRSRDQEAIALPAQSHAQIDERGPHRKIVLDAGYHGHVGIEYEGSRLPELEGVIATRKLLESIRDKIS